MPVKKLLLAAFIACMILLYFVGGGEKYLDIHMYQDLFERSPFITAMVFFFVFLVGTSFSLPVTAALGVASGIVFGTVIGFLISLVAVTMGGAASLLSSRFLFHDLVQRRFAAQVTVVNKGLEKEGALYVFGLRMVPVVPFAVLNLLMGLTSMRVSVFMLVTFCGMIPVMLILAYTGSQLGDIETFDVASILTPGLLLSLTLLASFPFIAKAILAYSRRFTGDKDTGDDPKV
jgi:uncharacterized membrane protein YdjX (TVP38/TMEM64 family)